MSALLPTVNYYFISFCCSRGTKIRSVITRKRKTKLSLFAADIIIYLENPREPAEKPLKHVLIPEGSSI